MRLRVCSVLLVLLSACATTEPSLKEQRARSLRVANLERAAGLPWRDEGRCVVREAENEWPVVAERCFHALEHERVRFHDVTGRCAVASAGAAVGVGGAALCILAAPEIAVGAVMVLGGVVVGVAIAEALEAYERRGPVEPEAGRQVARPAPQPQPAREPLASRRPKPEGSPLGRDWLPPDSVEREERHECRPVPVPHAGKDDAHNQCADTYPPNRYPGMDVLVNGIRFDALQVGVRVLWEIKTHRFDTYNDFLREQEIAKEIEQLLSERKAAHACGYDSVVGVSTEEHKAALLEKERTLKIVVTGCPR
jgi:hypothetical protein